MGSSGSAWDETARITYLNDMAAEGCELVEATAVSPDPGYSWICEYYKRPKTE